MVSNIYFSQKFQIRKLGESIVKEYLVKRIALAFITLFTVATLNFVIFQVLSPYDPFTMILDPNFTPEMKQILIEQYGLNETLEVRYIKYIQGMFTWNFGYSFLSKRLVVEQMAPKLANTILLLGSALVATVIVGIPVGILAASRRGSKLDVMAIGSGLLTWGVPIFFIQLLFMFFFCYWLPVTFDIKLFAIAGMTIVPPPEDPLTYMADVAWHLSGPLITLVLASFGSWALYTRNLLLDALTQDYVVTARAKGLSERTVLYRHAFRSTLPPMVTLIALSVPGIVTGAMITEFIFSWPGIGRWYLSSMNSGDYPVVQSVLFIYALLTILANITADILYGLLDPRIRVGMRR
jgi:peptide/nickel transport system permease protein